MFFSLLKVAIGKQWVGSWSAHPNDSLCPLASVCLLWAKQSQWLLVWCKSETQAELRRTGVSSGSYPACTAQQSHTALLTAARRDPLHTPPWPGASAVSKVFTTLQVRILPSKDGLTEESCWTGITMVKVMCKNTGFIFTLIILKGFIFQTKLCNLGSILPLLHIARAKVCISLR